MMQPRWKILLIVAVLAGTIVVGTSQADAYWWRTWYGPVGWYGYDSYWSDCCGGYGYWGVRPGPVRRAVLGPYRWYRGYGWDYCGYGCGTCWDGCGSCCGDVVGTVGCCGGGVTTAAPAMNPAPTPAAPAGRPTVAPPAPAGGFTPTPGPAPSSPVPPNTSTSPVRNGTGMLTIFVPEDAKVFVNGYETKSTGAQRRYISHGLKDGLTYKYEVRAQVIRDGKLSEEVRNVYLTSGAREGIAFNFNTAGEKDLAVVW